MLGKEANSRISGIGDRIMYSEKILGEETTNKMKEEDDGGICWESAHVAYVRC